MLREPNENYVKRRLLKVISTDMSKHMDHVANLRTRVELQNLSPTDDGKIILNSPTDRIQVTTVSFLSVAC